MGAGGGPNSIQPQPAPRTSAAATTRALRSRGSERQMPTEPVDATLLAWGGAAVAWISEACWRDMPQWQVEMRSGTPRPQLGQVQECAGGSVTALILAQLPPGVSTHWRVDGRRPEAWRRPTPPARMP